MNHTHIALAIVGGFLLVAISFYLTLTHPRQTGVSEVNSLTRVDNALTYGDAKAKIRIVEFSDFECPFCARLHTTLKQIIDESNGDIVWEYRHLPLPNHPKALPAAVASECVAEYAGLESFWEYSNQIFAQIGTLTDSAIKDTAVNLGISSEDYDQCIRDGEALARVSTDQIVAQSLKISGTPYSVILGSDGTQTPVSGALPYEQWMSIINQIK